MLDQIARLESASPTVAQLRQMSRDSWRSACDMPGAEQGFISSSVLTGFAALVADLGANASDLARRVGLRPDLCDTDCEQLLFRDYALLLETAAERLECPDFGMRLASFQMGTALMGPVAEAVASAETVAEAILCCARYMHVYSTGVQTHLDSYWDAGEALLVLDVLARGTASRRQAMEHLVSLSCDNVLRMSGGVTRAKEVWFAHEPLSCMTVYRRRFGCKVRFSEACPALLYSLHQLQAPVVTCDREAYRDIMSDLPRRFPSAASLSSRVQVEIVRTLHLDECSREATADALNMSPRTLHRRLRREGNTFETIRDEVRRDLTEHYLTQSDASITKISAWLGFAELAVFSRACRRWFGVCPTKLRSRLSARRVNTLERPALS